ncbi:MAG: DUF507 family protein [Thermoanaerobaculia bacterium]
MTRERVEQMAREILETMSASRAVVFLKSRDAVQQAIAQLLSEEMQREEEREDAVRRRIAGMRKPPARRSVEWEHLFRKLLEEEYLREGDV